MFLLDTNVVSEMRRPNPSLDVRTWVQNQARESQHLSAVSLMEVTRGAIRHPDAIQRFSIQQWIESTLRIWFEDRILAVSSEIAESAGVYMGVRDRTGQPLSLPDALIAATAVEHRFVLVTRNTKDFIGLPLDLHDPWKNEFNPGEKRR